MQAIMLRKRAPFQIYATRNKLLMELLNKVFRDVGDVMFVTPNSDKL